jgi:hypothetical protein
MTRSSRFKIELAVYSILFYLIVISMFAMHIQWDRNERQTFLGFVSTFFVSLCSVNPCKKPHIHHMETPSPIPIILSFICSSFLPSSQTRCCYEKKPQLPAESRTQLLTIMIPYMIAPRMGNDSSFCPHDGPYPLSVHNSCQCSE